MLVCSTMLRTCSAKKALIGSYIKAGTNPWLPAGMPLSETVKGISRASCIFIILGFRGNMKPLDLRIANYVLVTVAMSR